MFLEVLFNESVNC